MTEPRRHHYVVARQAVRDIAREYPVNFIAMLTDPAATGVSRPTVPCEWTPEHHVYDGDGPPPEADALLAAVGTILAAPAGAV
jgi:hypothetical protein